MSLQIYSVFEEKYCVCGHQNVDKFTNIEGTFIKYNNKLISFVEIVRETLNFEPSIDNCSMEICDQCKKKLEEFYNFKMKTISAMNAFKESKIFPSEEKNKLALEEAQYESIEYTLFDIIKEYIKTHSIKSIEMNEDLKGLLIVPGKTCKNSKEMSEELSKIDVNIVEETEPEYLEEFLDDPENIESDENETTECEMAVESEDKSFKIDNTRKRMRNPEEWACNKRKKLRNLGKSYLNSKGKIVGERKLLEPCNNCRSNCQKRLKNQDRVKNFNNYWTLGDIVEQRKFIFNHILSKEPLRRKSVQSNRTVSLNFYLDVWDAKGNVSFAQVCKKMFKNTLAISNQVIQGVVSKYSSTGFIDPRGKHKRKPTDAQILAQQHVQQFPFFYVEKNMTKVQLYNLYVYECKKKNIEPVKESNYREIFDKFNANSFLKSERVSCEKCHVYNNATEDEKLSLQKEYNQHLEEDKKCKDRALSRIRHRRSIKKRKEDNLQKLELYESSKKD